MSLSLLDRGTLLHNLWKRKIEWRVSPNNRRMLAATWQTEAWHVPWLSIKLLTCETLQPLLFPPLCHILSPFYHKSLWRGKTELKQHDQSLPLRIGTPCLHARSEMERWSLWSASSGRRSWWWCWAEDWGGGGGGVRQEEGWEDSEQSNSGLCNDLMFRKTSLFDNWQNMFE